MRDPERLNRGSRELERLLLESVRDDRPSAGVEARTMAALGAGTAIGVSSVTGGAAAVVAPKALWGAAAGLVAKWVVIGAGTGIAAVAIAHNVAPNPSTASALHASTVLTTAPPAPRDERNRATSLPPIELAPERPRAAFVLPMSPARHTRAPLAPEPVAIRTTPAAADPESSVIAPPPTSRALAPITASLASPSLASAPPLAPVPALASAPPPSALAQQIATLDTARRVLKSGDAPATLALLDAYANAFPSGDLMPEATLLRIQALLQLGRRSAAERVAAAFLANNPSSAHAHRIRRLLDSSPSH